MEIKYLIKSINTLAFMGNMDLQVKGLCYNSQQLKPGELFVAIKGFKTDGHQFLKDALERGACAFVIEDKGFLISWPKIFAIWPIVESLSPLLMSSCNFFSFM